MINWLITFSGSAAWTEDSEVSDNHNNQKKIDNIKMS